MTASADNYFVIPRSEKSITMGEQDVIFVVEGLDDCWFIGSILLELSADPKKVLIISADGKDKFLASLELIRKSSGFKTGAIRSLALIRDADTNFGVTLGETKRLLATLNFPQLDHDEIQIGNPSFGLYIFPRDQLAGDLEDLCLETVAGTFHHNLAESTFLEAHNARSLDHKSKRVSQIFLSVVPGERARGVGRGYSIGHFNNHHVALQPVKDFVSRVIA